MTMSPSFSPDMTALTSASASAALPALIAGGAAFPKVIHQRAGDIKRIDFGGDQRIDKTGVERRSRRSKFEHLAENGDSPPVTFRRHLTEQRERRRHRRRIGVVAFIKDGDFRRRI